jgi:hypothetical protein
LRGAAQWRSQFGLVLFMSNCRRSEKATVWAQKNLVVFDHVHLVEHQAGLCMNVGIEDHFVPLVLSDSLVLVAGPRAQPATGSSSIFGVGYNPLGAIGHEARSRLGRERACARACRPRCGRIFSINGASRIATMMLVYQKAADPG